MQLSILSAADALATLFNSWLSLQNQCNNGADNSNSYLRLADEIQAKPESNLLVLCVHDGDPTRELHALCVVETQRSWIASKRTLANWIGEPGLDSTPLSIEEQRFSAIDTIFRELPSLDSSAYLCLRHMLPQSSTVLALQAISQQHQLRTQIESERNNTLCELKILLKSRTDLHKSQQLPPLFESTHSLP